MRATRTARSSCRPMPKSRPCAPPTEGCACPHRPPARALRPDHHVPLAASVMNLSSLCIQLLNGLAGASSLFLVAAGLSLIFGITRIVNFAHGSLMMLGAYLAYSMIGRFGSGPLGYWGGVLLAALSVGALGVLIERMLLRRLYGAPELLQLIATFGVVLLVKDAALAIWGAEDLLGPRAPGLAGAITIFGQPVPQYDPMLIA